VKLRYILGVLPLLAACTHGNATAPAAPGGPTTAACTFHNPIGPGADPWVIRDGDVYHLVESRDGGIWVTSSDRLERVKEHAVKVWSPPASGWNRTNVWAPELHHIGDRWYIYYAAGESGPPFIHQRSGVLESVGDDPQGAYVDRGMLHTGDDPATGADPVWAIDLTVAEVGGRLYAVWSGWEANATTD
jgi:GH43 family beta-xylosidase